MSESPQQGLFRWLWHAYMARHIWVILLALLFMTIEGSMLGAMSYIMKPMFDQVFVGGDTDAALFVGLLILGIFLLRASASIAQKVLLARLSEVTAAHIRTDMIGHLMRLDGDFHATHPPGLVMQRIEGDVGSINQVWATIITGAGRDFVAVIALMAVAVSVDWRWTLIACIATPFLILPSILVQRFVRSNARLVRDISADLSTRLNEIFHGINPIKLNTLEDYQVNRYRALAKKRINFQTKAVLGQGGMSGIMDVMSGIGFLAVVVYGANEIISGQKSVGDFMSFFTAIGLAFEPLRRLGTLSATLQIAAAGIERVKGLLDFKPSLLSPETPDTAPSGAPVIVLENVSLSYAGTEVLKNVSFTAEAGKTTALVGASGAGKSTIFNLLTRLVDPQIGQITLSGVSVDSLRLEDLPQLYSVVAQDALLFDESLRENILLGQTDIAPETLQVVLDAAHISDFLPRLTKGLETPVGPRGSLLSGGQRQRVAIARALLRNTPILLLDEATSALDAQSENMVQAALDKLSKGRTTLVIAHRLATIRNADKIIVMAHGKVVEIGTHEALMARNGAYTELYNLQLNEAKTA